MAPSNGTRNPDVISNILAGERRHPVAGNFDGDGRLIS
jgi:hypothetical protein